MEDLSISDCEMGDAWPVFYGRAFCTNGLPAYLHFFNYYSRWDCREVEKLELICPQRDHPYIEMEC